ncbi:glycosyltransferase [Niabella pedocola]|uniref:Glycosyltransferase n=1 Tax=Niabella pedocola TaxID=1752077 RepID=A0ABS8PVT8_9BACT|nr:glycosyltransferase [Niabella pedocola]MCD2425197.1 glycosyltransferase [Niabella pedocola]
MIYGQSNVTVVVVTFNRRQLLERCLDAIKNQRGVTPNILVVNNNSTDGTTEWLATQEGLKVISQENKGGAFGFYTGIKTAFEDGAEWIWCMDDDGQPATDALMLLLKHQDKKPCVLSPVVLDIEDRKTIVFKTGNFKTYMDLKEPLIDNVGYPFNGTMLHRAVVEKAGLPRKELVIWGDESEYWNRILYRHQFHAYLVSQSHHYHPAQYTLFYLKEWDLKTGWKVYFYIRNKPFVYQSRYTSAFIAHVKAYYFVLGFFYTIMRYQKNDKKLKFKLARKAIKDGFRGNTSMGIKDVVQYIAKLTKSKN